VGFVRFSFFEKKQCQFAQSLRTLGGNFSGDSGRIGNARQKPKSVVAPL
jgi:hypothetical protein